MAGWTSDRARHNALKRYRADDDPDVIAAARDLRASRAEAYIKRLVDEAPPLSPEVRERLALILRGDS